MFNSSKFNSTRFNSISTLTEIIVHYYNVIINLVRSVNTKMTLIRDNAKINLNPRKYR